MVLVFCGTGTPAGRIGSLGTTNARVAQPPSAVGFSLWVNMNWFERSGLHQSKG